MVGGRFELEIVITQFCENPLFVINWSFNMPRKTRTQSRKRPAPEPMLVTSNLFGEGRRLKPFGGDTPKLVLSIDIGTTFSAASFCILKPRTPPNLEIVR